MSSALTVLPAFLVLPVALLVPQDADPCKCPVVNRCTVGTASGTCTIPGQGTVPCFSGSTATYPQGGQPQDGVCVAPPVCSGSGFCTYKTMRVNVTIASCAASCGVPASVRWQEQRPGDNDPSGTQAINTSQDHDVNAAGIDALCGTPETTVHLVFFKSNGLTAYKLDFTFGCGQCPAQF